MENCVKAAEDDAEAVDPDAEPVAPLVLELDAAEGLIAAPRAPLKAGRRPLPPAPDGVLLTAGIGPGLEVSK